MRCLTATPPRISILKATEDSATESARHAQFQEKEKTPTEVDILSKIFFDGKKQW